MKPKKKSLKKRLIKAGKKFPTSKKLMTPSMRKSLKAKRSFSGIGKPVMQLSRNKAREIAGNWHGGQWSALYQFASSGVYLPENHSKYIREISEDIPLASTTQRRLLKKLKAWFVYKSKEQK